MNNPETRTAKGNELADRLSRFGAMAIFLVAQFPKGRASKVVEDQLLRCALAIGAHYEEARGAQSSKDFIYKVSIALKEAREACHWLRVVRYAHWENVETAVLEDECQQLVRILSASKATAMRRASR